MRSEKNHLKLFFVPPFLILLYFQSTSQQLPVFRNIESAYQKTTRSADGKPGKNYWQNRADYDLKINFDPVSRILTGTEQVNYMNNSPDTLKTILFKLYPNLYKKGAMRQAAIKPSDISDGVTISSILVNNAKLDSTSLRTDGTNMLIPHVSVLPHQTIVFNISWSYILNKSSDIRTGEIDPGADFVAYFFPRIAVYDDIDGWNTYPYNGTQEFYNDFCHFKAAITVPNNQLVWATGNLLNGKEVLADKVVQRLQSAEKNDAIATLVDSTEFTSATNHANAMNTWMYEADDVTDFVFACSDHYMWKSTSVLVDKTTGRRTRVDAVFNPKHKDYFTVISDARKTVEAMSFNFPKWPFPYAHETVFDGLDQMEYPMMVNDNPVADHAESVELTDHEIFHTMFPFYMGINETKYAWMDEGWATIGEWVISPLIDTTLLDLYAIDGYEKTAGKEIDVPIISLSTEMSASYYTNSYGKPAIGYAFVKDMLGDSLFTKAIHYYIREWHGKHPIPYDFFYCMNQGSGKNLNWFWKRWFFDDGYPDLALTSVNKRNNGYTVVITAKGTKPIPVNLTIKYGDNTIGHLHRSIEAWELGNKTYTAQITTNKKISQIILGGPYDPDVNKSDNIYIVK
ncbi:MAG: M1 family metallopeptidase [Ginsengibacter sp.]